MKHLFQKRLVSLFMLSLTTVGAVLAAPRTVEQARQVAKQQISKHAVKKVNGQGGATISANPQLVFSKKKLNATADEAYYHVFSAGKNLGYTIVSGDDRFPAIVGYTEQGDYDANNLPTNLASFMQAYQDFVDNATEAQIAEINAWKAQAAHASVAPFMPEKWNQGDPYNRMCPEYKYNNSSNGGISTGKAVTGCVATAVAQILHFHKCPNELKADIPEYNFTYTVNDYENQYSMPAIYANGETYDWGNMLNVYTGNATEVQKDAVAKLMFHIGCAVKMKYGPSSGSSASAETFTKYFGMDKELVKQLYRSNYQISEWDKILYEEMAAGRPVYYNGQSTGGGHAFVIHGYNDGLYYVNWGWGGMCDGYFDITILNPDNTTGAGASSSDDGYSMSNGMIIGIQPDNGVVDEVLSPVFTVRDLSVSDLALNGNVTAEVQFKVINFNTVKNSRYVSVGYKDENGTIYNIGGDGSYITIQQATDDGRGYSQTPKINISFMPENGKLYELIAIESLDKEKWVACRKENSYIPKTIKVENGEVNEVTPQSTLSAKAELDENSGGYATMSNSINVTVTNTGDKEYYDKVYVFVSNTDTKPSGYTFALGITAPVDGSTTFNFAYTPKTAGTYNFWIWDVDKNEIGKSSIEFKAAGTPVLSFVSITCDNASNDKEYAKFQTTENVEMNKVYDVKADFVFEVKNEGGYYQGSFIFVKYNPSTGGWSYSPSSDVKTLTVPAETTTKFTFSVEGNVGDVVGVRMTGSNGVSISPLTGDMINRHQSNSGTYNLNNSEICYLAGYNTDKTLTVTGSLSEDDIKALNNKLEHNDVITSLDLTEATINTETVLETANDNTLILIEAGSKVGNTKNVVVKSGNNYTCANFELTDAMPFNTDIPFTAENASYTRVVSNVATRAAGENWCSVCLPYVANIPDDVTVEAFTSVDTDARTVTFEPVTTMEANMPYIYQAAGEVKFTASNVEVNKTPEEIKKECFIGTYEGIPAPGLEGFYILKSDGTGFGIATATAYAVPFRAVIDTKGQANTAMLTVIHGDGDGTTGITEVGTDADNAGDYYNLNGVKVTTPQKGIYIKNGKKYIFK
ncbi:MAG: C10 family peptidase [Prevotella sp.]|nr:C10 family peptidase [Prevotella sp.]